MSTSMLRLGASAAAARLGVSIKALRLYEQRGLVAPARTPAGYRVYGAADIVALRALGLTLAQVSRVLDGDACSLDEALASHEAALADAGAIRSPALIALLAFLDAEGSGALVVDLIEQDLDEATQRALIARLRERAEGGARPLFLMTRSTAILDLSLIGPDEAIILCPANHSPPSRVAPYRGAPGYEAVATCLAPPAVRMRIACRREGV